MSHLGTGREIIEALACGQVNGAVAGMLLPATDGYVDIKRIDLDAEADATNAFCSNQSATGPEKAIQDNVCPRRAVEQGISYKCDGFHGRMEGKQIAFLTLSGKRVYARIFPDIGPIAPVLAKLDIIAM